MASKSFRSLTGVTVWMAEPSGASREIRLNADETYETDDKAEIAALQGSSEVEEVKAAAASHRSRGDDDD